jgi:hypothetical protein
MRRFLRENGLSIALFGFFLLALAGQSIAGHLHDNEQRREHGGSPLSLLQYLGSGGFFEAVFENWESEFLQMGAFVLMTIFLKQKGSPDSKKLEGGEEVDREPTAPRVRPDAPGPVHRGGWVLKLYENSLSIALFLLFLFSFVFHAVGGAADYSADQLEHGSAPVSIPRYLTTSRFWFESLQNWQSEFLSVGVLTVFSIFLRQRGSPMSKPVDAPHSETGH